MPGLVQGFLLIPEHVSAGLGQAVGKAHQPAAGRCRVGSVGREADNVLFVAYEKNREGRMIERSFEARPLREWQAAGWS